MSGNKAGEEDMVRWISTVFSLPAFKKCSSFSFPIRLKKQSASCVTTKYTVTTHRIHKPPF